MGSAVRKGRNMPESFDLDRVLEHLVSSRPVFHSEADFQFAFAWSAITLYPTLEVKLESHPTPNESLDLALFDPISNEGLAIEFKYKTGAWDGVVNGESYSLKSHGGSDIGCYDIVKDITRIERFIEGKAGWKGYVITLTNESGYWNLRTHGKATNAGAFRVSHGLTLNGIREWGPNTGGTKKGREQSLVIKGSYDLKWRNYSKLSDRAAGTFKLLVVAIK